MTASPDQHSGCSSSTPTWVGRRGIPGPCGDTGCLSEMSVLPPAISRSSAIASTRSCWSAAWRHAVPCKERCRGVVLLWWPCSGISNESSIPPGRVLLAACADQSSPCERGARVASLASAGILATRTRMQGAGAETADLPPQPCRIHLIFWVYVSAHLAPCWLCQPRCF